MSQIKLHKFGQTLGFQVSSLDLEKADFDEKSDYELIVKKGVLMFVKKRPHHSYWVFNDPELSDEDILWLESHLDTSASGEALQQK